MAIQPIDLQTLFLRLNQIGQEQSAERNALLQGQAVAGSEIARRSELEKSVVRESHDVEGGPEQLHDDDESNAEQKQDHSRHDRSDSSDDLEVFRDPDLGRNVDVSG
ncbi:MAG: hypothetical protein EA404_08060 [Spirochaetaceae bacterium]|nr:MAG: hypothetical protein EA404_08060 [Spirochaetaceae bacterium]